MEDINFNEYETNNYKEILNIFQQIVSDLSSQTGATLIKRENSDSNECEYDITCGDFRLGYFYIFYYNGIYSLRGALKTKVIMTTYTHFNKNKIWHQSEIEIKNHRAIKSSNSLLEWTKLMVKHIKVAKIKKKIFESSTDFD